MRIMLISRGDVFPPTHGAAVKIVRTAEALAALDQAVYFVSDDRGRYHRCDQDGWHELRYPDGEVGDRGVRPLLDGLLATQGVPRDDRFLFSPLIDLDFWRRAVWVARRHAIEIAQAEFPAYAAPALAARALAGCRTVMVEHNVEHLRIADSAGISPRVVARLRAWEVALCRAVDRVVLVSDDDRQRLQAVGVPDRKLRVLPHGVDLPSYQGLDRRRTRRGLGVRADEVVLFYHGVLNYPPNREAALRLAERIVPPLRARGLKVCAMVGGDGPPPWDGDPSVRFLGCIPTADLAATVAAADLAVIPLVGGGGTRMKILEYFAAGVPVISTRKGAEGLALTGDEVLYADTDEELVAAVEGCIREPERAAALAEAGRRWVAEYDWVAIGQRYLDLYREILPGGPGGR